jgi:hypothetical protein
MAARPTATTVRAGSRTASSSALVPGDVHITEGPTVAALRADLRDADLKDVALRDAVLMDMVLIDMVRRLGAASKGAAEAKASAEDPMEGPAAAANNKLIGSSDRVI